MYGTVGRRWYYDGGYAWYGWYDGWHGREGHKTLYVGNCWNRYDSSKLSLACLACYLLLHFPLPLSGHLYISKGVWAVDSPSIPETISGWTKLIKIDLPQLAFLCVFAQRQIDQCNPRLEEHLQNARHSFYLLWIHRWWQWLAQGIWNILLFCKYVLDENTINGFCVLHISIQELCAKYVRSCTLNA